jgi:hypothetical protein
MRQAQFNNNFLYFKQTDENRKPEEKLVVEFHLSCNIYINKIDRTTYNSVNRSVS